jgi:hypothetical protein
MPRVPIPQHLLARAFRVSHDAGLGERRMYGVDLSRPTHGVRSLAAHESVTDLARATRIALPDDAAFSHTTAAEILGLPLPRWHQGGPLHVMRSSEQSRIRRHGCTPHRGLENRDLLVTDGLRVVGLADTWCDLGELLDLDDLVVLGDAVARRLDTLDPLREALERRNRPRGATRLRRALRWIRIGSDSPMETRCRLVFVRGGLPEPELNVRIGFAGGGGFLCRADFVWKKGRVIGEYHGERHFGSFQRFDDDISRRLLAQDDGWKYVEITKNDYFNPARRHQLLSRLRRYLLD